MRRRRHLGIFGLLAIIAGLWALDRYLPPDLHRWDERSSVLLAHDGTILHVATTRDGMWRLGTRPEGVDSRYLAMLLAAEDNRFRGHIGIDPLAAARATWQLLSTGRVVSGGSTLTMQVARLLEPHPRSLAGKLHDIVRAVQLEERFGKDEILAMYLTLAPFGGNVEGVRAASLTWFGHEPDRLTPGEAAILVALPQRPAALRPDRHPARILVAASR
ncbi:MAG: penicillin-binding protein, partial [Aliidongia sp.]|nr:penicillin-binding protein [Aliidongia sp.]